MELRETDLENYQGLYGQGFKGNAYQVYNETQEIGFALIELYEVEGKECGTFHSFILPSYRTAHNALEYLKKVFELCFNQLNLYKVYTLANERQAKYFNWSKRMVDEKRQVLGLEVFSLTKEGYQCQQQYQ